MTVTETVDKEAESPEIEFRLLADDRFYPIDFDALVRSITDKRTLAALIFDFYRGFKYLFARISRQEILLGRLVAERAFVPDTELLEAAIETSMSILALEDDFDGRGSPHYSRATWDRAIQFVRLQWVEFVRLFREPMPIPTIQPGPNGSIDVFWETPDFDLLVNIPPDPLQEAEFSGDRNGKRKFDGTLNPALPNRGLVSWLVK